MNLELLNPFAQDFPETLLETLSEASANCTKFNRSGLFSGNYLAIGRVDGVVVIMDFETKGIVRWLEGHVKGVTTVCWSHNSRYLLSASRDWNVIIWDLSIAANTSLAGERRDTIRFDGPITSAHLHPRNSKLVIVTLAGQVEPVLVDLRSSGGRWELIIPSDEMEDDEEDEEDRERNKKAREISTMARFNPKGDLIYGGTNKGNLNVWDVQTRMHLWTESVSNSAVKQMEFDRLGSALVVNCNDRCIRVLSLTPSEQYSPPPEEELEDGEEQPLPHPINVPYFEIQHKFQDLVEKIPWSGCGFSRDGDYIIGGAGHKASHNIYIWDRSSGGLMKILEGPKDPLEDIDWHPTRPLIASVSDRGAIHIWVTKITENWSAYAPGFEELDENQEYMEKEDEFDIEDESVLKQRKEDEQDKFIDINTIPKASTILSIPLNQQDEYEKFITAELCDDLDEKFFPPPEFLDWYEPEVEEFNGKLAVRGASEDTGQEDGKKKKRRNRD